MNENSNKHKRAVDTRGRNVQQVAVTQPYEYQCAFVSNLSGRERQLDAHLLHSTRETRGIFQKTNKLSFKTYLEIYSL